MALIFLLSSLHAMAQHHTGVPYYQCLTLKTNMLSLFNLSLECPVYKRVTLEASGRYFRYGTVPGDPGGYAGDNRTTSFRLNMKYHFSIGAGQNSLYVFSGMNMFNKTRYKYNDEHYYYKHTQHMARAVAGIGTKMAWFDLWIAAEYPIMIFDNSSYIYTFNSNMPGPRTAFPIVPVISGGIAFNLIHTKI